MSGGEVKITCLKMKYADAIASPGFPHMVLQYRGRTREHLKSWNVEDKREKKITNTASKVELVSISGNENLMHKNRRK